MMSVAFAQAERIERLVRNFLFVTVWCCGLLLPLEANSGAAEFANQRSIEILSASEGISISLDSEGEKLEIRWNHPGDIAAFQVKIDDSPYFRCPIIARDVRGRNLAIGVLDSGLAPGIPYFVRVEPGNMQTSFRIRHQAWRESLPSPEYLRKAWEVAGRSWFQRYSGIKWDDTVKRWEFDPQWPDGEARVGPMAYYLEYAARGAVNLALVGHDLELMDELAGFYLIYLKRFTTLGQLRQKKSLLISIELLENQGPDSTRTLAWLEKGTLRSRLRECLLCNTQFFHPAARLIRIISTLSVSERTSVMKQFVAAYWPLVVRDHLLRLLYEAHWNYWGAQDLPKKLINIWRAIIGATVPPKLSYQHGMHDWDVWLIATAAEMLGANANDPNLVPLSAEEVARLQEIVRVGVQLFQKKRTVYQDTHDFQGNLVQSASYFNGDFDDHPEMAFTGYNGKSFPSPTQKQPRRGSSWDISHFYRVPVFLRSLYDNGKATGLNFPQARDIELVINQYIYMVFQGDFSRPLFRNFFDGHDGWYRVGYHGPNFGYPPSTECDMRDAKRPCLTVAGIYGWGLIAFFHDELMKLQQALIKLALARDEGLISFRERYYLYNGESFAFTDGEYKIRYPFLLFAILSGVPERFL